MRYLENIFASVEESLSKFSDLPQATIDTSSIERIASTIVNWLLIIATGVVIIMVLAGAIIMMTAGGNQTKAANAKNLIIYALIGFAVALLTRALIVWVANTLLNV